MSYNVEQLKSLISRRGGVAQANMWKVHLPALPGVQSSRDLNVLCKDVQLPGRQILTQERTIGMKPKKVAYAYGEEDVPMTFLLLNDYGVKHVYEEFADNHSDLDYRLDKSLPFLFREISQS